MENKKGYEFFCIDNSFNENEFFNDSKILIIKFDTAMVFPSEILSKIPSSINNLNSANAIFTEEKQSFLYFKSNNYFCEFYSENYQLVLRANNKQVILDYDDLIDEETGDKGIASVILKDGSFLPIYVAAGIFNNSIELAVFSQSHDLIKDFGISSGVKFVSKKNSGDFILDTLTRKLISKNTVEDKIIYENEQELIKNVQNIISSLNNVIYTFGGIKSFWNTENKKKIPKIETDAQDALCLMLADKLTKAGLDMHKEEVTPAGNVDFYISGHVKDIGQCGVCIEVKNAHSDKLEDGYLKQLPEYVKRKNALYGIYLVLYFNSDKYPVYKKYINSLDPIDELNILKTSTKYEQHLKNIVAYSLDVSKPIQASNL